MAKNKRNQSKLEAALQKPQRPDKSETYTTFALWQSAAIAQGALELVDLIETVGNKQSTLNKIDALRRAIVYTDANQIYPKLQDDQANLKLIEFKDLLLAVLEEILPYYKSLNKKPVPVETVENLKRLAGQLQQYAVEYKEHIPLETVTDEMRSLADEILNYNYPDICLTGKASGISFILGAIVCDLYESKKLTEDEMQAKSYLSQSKNLLNEFPAKRSWPKNAKEQQQFKNKTSEDIKYFADQLDKNPVIKQYQDFSYILNNENKKILNILEKTNPSNSESNKSRKHLSEEDNKRFFERKPVEQKPIDDLEYLRDWIKRIKNYMDFVEEKFRKIEESNPILPDAERYDILTNESIISLYEPFGSEIIALTCLYKKYPFAIQPIKDFLESLKNECYLLCNKESNEGEKLIAAEKLHDSLFELMMKINTAIESIEKSRAETNQSEQSGGGADIKEGQRRKIYNKTKMGLREFLEKRTDAELGVIDSKIKRIKAVDKKKSLLPKVANKPKGNQTKLYYEDDLIAVWSNLKDAIPTLPNLK